MRAFRTSGFVSHRFVIALRTILPSMTLGGPSNAWTIAVPDASPSSPRDDPGSPVRVAPGSPLDVSGSSCLACVRPDFERSDGFRFFFGGLALIRALSLAASISSQVGSASPSSGSILRRIPSFANLFSSRVVDPRRYRGLDSRRMWSAIAWVVNSPLCSLNIIRSRETLR